MKSMRNFLRGIIFFGTIHTSMCGFSQVRLTIATNRRSVTVPLISKETAVFAAGVAAISYSAYKMVQSWHARSHQQKKMQAQEALFRACKEGNRIEAETALQAGAEINVPFSNGDTPLITATIFKHGKLVQRLLKLGADCTFCDTQGRYALDHAQQYAQHDETIASLLKNAATRALWDVIVYKTAHEMQAPLKAGANVHETDAQGFSMLTVAIVLLKDKNSNPRDTKEKIRTLLVAGAYKLGDDALERKAVDDIIEKNFSHEEQEKIIQFIAQVRAKVEKSR